jgi:hypothetical protein
VNIYSWLTTLKEPYKSKAIRNTNNQSTRELSKIFTVQTLPEALIGAFDFTTTPEGIQYWWDFYQSTLKPQQRELTPIPTQRD